MAKQSISSKSVTVTGPVVEVDEQARTITITLPLEPHYTASKSGKNKTVASTRGNFRSDTTLDGLPITVGVNAYIPNTD